MQVKHELSGYLVQPGDWDAVACHLVDLFTSEQLHATMSLAAKAGISDEVGTVGNALSWYFLASRFAVDDSFKGNARWLNDVAREEAGRAYKQEEIRLPR